MDLGLPPIGNMGNGLTYNDFDYIGYNTRDTKMFQSQRSNVNHLQNYSPREPAPRAQKTVSTIMSPRVVSKVNRSDN